MFLTRELALTALAVFAEVETTKRFVPKKYRKWVNPILAVLWGTVDAYFILGAVAAQDVLVNGVAAAVIAVAGYKLPKVVGRELGTEPPKIEYKS